MMTGGEIQTGGEQVEPDGVRWLRLIGLDEYVGKTTEIRGVQVRAEDFVGICGDSAKDAFVYLESLEQGSEEKRGLEEALRQMFYKHFQKGQR